MLRVVRKQSLLRITGYRTVYQIPRGNECKFPSSGVGEGEGHNMHSKIQEHCKGTSRCGNEYTNNVSVCGRKVARLWGGAAWEHKLWGSNLDRRDHSWLMLSFLAFALGLSQSY